VRIMLKEVKQTRTYKDDGRLDGTLPVGLLVEPLAGNSTEVLVKDLSNGYNYIITRADWEANFVRLS
jgi:hypothetical protein